MDKIEQEEFIARNISLKTGLIEKCEVHGYYMDNMSFDYEEADALIGELVADPDEIVADFESPHELKDMVCRVVNQTGKESKGCVSNRGS